MRPLFPLTFPASRPPASSGFRTKAYLATFPRPPAFTKQMSSTANPQAEDPAAAQPLALPAPPAEEQQQRTRTLNVQEENTVTLDELGPLIVNSDGVSSSFLSEGILWLTPGGGKTLSRISNWKSLSPMEQERMVRLIVKRRNVQRLDKLKGEQGEEGEGEKED